jgi:hypothetical protein
MHNDQEEYGGGFENRRGFTVETKTVDITSGSYDFTPFHAGLDPCAVIDVITVYLESGAIEITVDGGDYIKFPVPGGIFYCQPLEVNGLSVGVLGVTVGADGPTGKVTFHYNAEFKYSVEINSPTPDSACS